MDIDWFQRHWNQMLVGIVSIFLVQVSVQAPSNEDPRTLILAPLRLCMIREPNGGEMIPPGMCCTIRAVMAPGYKKFTESSAMTSYPQIGAACIKSIWFVYAISLAMIGIMDSRICFDSDVTTR